MRRVFADFLKNEDGAVTVDWVVLTAAIVGLGIGVIASVQTATTSTSGNVGQAVGDTVSILPNGG